MLPRTILYGFKALTMQWKSPQTIKKFQEKRLQYIVNHAYRNSRFYKTIFTECNITPGDIKTLNDLKILPTVTKTDLRTHFLDVLARGFSEKNCAVETTSGSTGEKITILHDFNAIDYYSPVHQRGHIALGLRPYHKAVYIRYKPLNKSVLEQFGLFRFHHIFSDNPLDAIIKELKQVRPFEIGCYPTVMYLLAKKIAEKDVQYLSPHHIMTWSEKLTPKIRKTIQETFGCPVYDQYGSFEFHIMGCECPEKQMHINADVMIMEVIKDGEPAAPGEQGEIVVTNLWNKAMPFIRYKIGDIGVLSDEICACGRGLPIMKELEGRTDDFLVTPSGDIILPSKVVPIFFPYDEIDAFQIVQKRKDALTIKIVKGDAYTESIDGKIIDEFKDIFGEIDIKIEYVETIKKTQGGKLRSIVSEVG
jgi:phenylacetate-CoA ligase